MYGGQRWRYTHSALILDDKMTMTIYTEHVSFHFINHHMALSSSLRYALLSIHSIHIKKT